MGFATTPTWLSLDRWAEIMGINPLHFNGIVTALSPEDACNDVWMQYNWQAADRVSREELAQAINQAEQMIATHVGYNLIPDWVVDERLLTVRPAAPNLFSNGYNVRLLAKSFRTKRHLLLTGGQRSKTLISAGATIVRSDEDGDGYDERCTVSVATTVTDVNEIRVYYPGTSADDTYEVRPLKVTISGGNVVIKFKIWQVPKEENVLGFGQSSINGDVVGNFETTVDVYRVWNDPQSQVQFLWEPGDPDCGCGSATCTNCSFTVQAGCLHIRDPRLGWFAYSPAAWDAVDEEFDTVEWTVTRDPDQIRVWYLAGNRDMKVARPWVDMEPYWEKAVAYFAAALLERPICGCDNVTTLVEKWQEDLAVSASGKFVNLTPSQIGSPFGTTRGALYAWNRVNEEGRRIT